MTKLRRVFTLTILVAAVVATLSTTVAAQTAADGSLASVVGGGSTVKWDIGVSNNGGTLTITFPDGRSVRKTFRAGAAPEVSLGEKYFDSLPDGVYVYELRLAPTRSAALKEAMGTRARDDEPEGERAGRKRHAVQPLVQSGSFAVANGSIVVAGAVEPGQHDRASAPVAPARTRASGNVAQRIRNNHRVFFMPDQVIPDDLIVQGSLCVGLDCVNNEPFSFDTIRMKENNTRIFFMDTSTGTFPATDWVIRANSNANGGQSFLAFVNQGNTGAGDENGTIIFEVDAGAPANSLRVSSTGNIGLGTATPVLDLHANTSDTPAFRLEQNNTGGFSAQTWDIAGNEANFFVRDVTSGSRLPFRIRPGAPTSSVDIAANGFVGIGTAGPRTTLDIKQLSDTFVGGIHLRRSTTNDTWALATGGDNNLYIAYANDASLADAQGDFATNPLVITANNRVGVRTAAPDQAFSVNGDASKTGGGSWQIFSDERLKRLNGKFTPGLSAVMRLQPFRYSYKPDNALGLKDSREHIGFRAQELKEIVPEAVSTSENGYLMVNNDPILWTMLNAIKEQQKQIEELKAEVRTLKARARRQRR